METQSPNKQTWGSAAFKISRANIYRKRFSSGDGNTTEAESAPFVYRPEVVVNRVWFLLLLIVVIFGYLLTGAFLFKLIEEAQDKKIRVDVLKIKEELVASFMALSMEFIERAECGEANNLNLSNEFQKNINQLKKSDEGNEFEKNTEKLAKKFLDKISKSVMVDGWNGRLSETNWNVIRSLRYCFTVITTIGYGDITAKTACGRMLTIVYAFFGIPLIMLFIDINGKYMTYLLNISYYIGNKKLNRVIEVVKYYVICTSKITGLSLLLSRLLSKNIRQGKKPTCFSQSGCLRKIKELSIQDDNENCDKGGKEIDYEQCDTNTEVKGPEKGSCVDENCPETSKSNSSMTSTQTLKEFQRHWSRKIGVHHGQLGIVHGLDDLRRKCLTVTGKKEPETAPGWWYLSAVLTYIIIGALMFKLWDGLDFFLGIYATFISLSTIGFGDLVFGNNFEGTFAENSKLIGNTPSEQKLSLHELFVFIHSLYVFFGLPFIPTIIGRVQRFMEQVLNTETEILLEYNAQRKNDAIKI